MPPRGPSGQFLKKRNPARKRRRARANVRRRRSNSHARTVVVNPRRRRAAKARKNSRPRRRTRRSNPGEELILMANPRRRRASRNRRRNRMSNPRRRTRRSNPGPRLRRSTRRHNRRRNPSSGDIFNALKMIIAGGAGAIVSPMVSNTVLGANNTGMMGYAGNIAVGGVLAYVTHLLTKSKDLASAVLVGATASTIVRIYNDNVGPLHADPATGTLSAYENTGFALPSVSYPDPTGTGMVAVQPPFATQIPTVSASQASSVGNAMAVSGRTAPFSRYSGRDS
jgi:hypothetical protein